MGASESTERSNNQDEDERNNTGGGSGTGKAIVAAAGAAVVAWGVYKMVSTNQETDGQENDARMKMLSRSPGGPFLLPSMSQIEPQGKSSNAWTPPPQGIYKLNTDANSKNPGPGGYGGILRDHQGNWIRGFRGYIEDGDILNAELQGILKGLELLNSLGYKGSILESDSQQAINWINGDNRSYQKINRYEEIIKRCRLLRQVNNISFECIPRDHNKCADKLAKMGVKGGKQEPYVEMSDIPDDDQLKGFIRSDQSCIAFSNSW